MREEEYGFVLTILEIGQPPLVSSLTEKKPIKLSFYSGDKWEFGRILYWD
jgi:hypothetical protein